MASLLHSNRSAGRSKSNTSHTTISTSLPQLTLSTRNIRSGSNLSHRNESPRSPFSPASSRSRPKHIVVKTDRDMSSQKASSPFPNTNTSAKQSSANHAKLHRRGGSGSLPGPPSPFVGGHQFTTPYATYEESYPDVTPTSATASSTPKIKPYLRKMSSSKDDQGTIDLNKSIAENERLAGLGISDFASRSAADVSFGHPSRRQTHARTTSIGSQVSNGSGTFRPGQPFVHPATKVPRPYTPPGASYASSLNDEHANESDDVVEDEFRLGAFRTKRSMSITSTNPTPLSQSHTASDLGLVPKLTSASQSNLSTISRASSPSGTKGRSRRGTDHSELALSPQTTGGRPSIDKAFSLVSGRRSDPDTQSRDELIRNARRKFEEKEARKDSKQQKRRESDEARKEAAKQRKQSTASRSAKSEEKIPAKKRKGSAATVLGGAQQEDEELADTVYGRSYENYRPAHDATLPRYGDRPGESEKTGQIQYSTTKHEPRSGSWMRFSTWVQTRMLSCGGGGH